MNFFSVPYLFILSIYALVAFIPQKRTQYFLCGLIFILFFGLRGFVGWDWYSYYAIYNQPIYAIIDKYTAEPIFGFLLVLCKTIGLDYFAFSFVSTSINYILLHLIFKEYLNKYAWGYFFFIVFSIEYEIDLLRNIKGLLLFVISIKFIQERKFFKFLLLNLIGLGFHSSSIVFFFLYFLINRILIRKIVLILFIIGCILFVSQTGIAKIIINPLLNYLDGSYALLFTNYLESDLYSASYGLSLGFLERVITFFIIYKNEQKILSLNKYSHIFINVAYIYMLLMLYFTDFTIFIDRIAAMFRFFYWILLPYILFTKGLLPYRKYIIIFYLIFSFARTTAMTNNILYNYDNVLFGTKTYYERKNIWETFYMNNY